MLWWVATSSTHASPPSVTMALPQLLPISAVFLSRALFRSVRRLRYVRRVTASGAAATAAAAASGHSLHLPLFTTYSTVWRTNKSIDEVKTLHSLSDLESERVRVKQRKEGREEGRKGVERDTTPPRSLDGSARASANQQPPAYTGWLLNRSTATTRQRTDSKPTAQLSPANLSSLVLHFLLASLTSSLTPSRILSQPNTTLQRGRTLWTVLYSVTATRRSLITVGAGRTKVS